MEGEMYIIGFLTVWFVLVVLVIAVLFGISKLTRGIFNFVDSCFPVLLIAFVLTLFGMGVAGNKIEGRLPVRYEKSELRVSPLIPIRPKDDGNQTYYVVEVIELDSKDSATNPKIAYYISYGNEGISPRTSGGNSFSYHYDVGIPHEETYSLYSVCVPNVWWENVVSDCTNYPKFLGYRVDIYVPEDGVMIFTTGGGLSQMVPSQTP